MTTTIGRSSYAYLTAVLRPLMFANQFVTRAVASHRNGWDLFQQL